MKQRGVYSSKEVGNQYEALAAEYLQKKGYGIIERNFLADRVKLI